MHALVEPLEGIGDDVHVQNLGLLAIPVGEVFDILQKPGIADAAVLSRLERVVDQVKPAQVFRREIGIAPELYFFAEILDEIVV